MRLLLVTQDFPPQLGGIETYSLELATRLAHKGVSVDVVAPAVRGARSVDTALDVPVRRILSTPNTLALYMKGPVRRMLRDGSYDAVFHAQWQTARVALEARERGWVRRVFIAAHGRELLLQPYRRIPPVQRHYAQVRRHLLTHADALFPVSRYTAGLLREAGVDAPRVHVIPNGVNADRFAPGDATPLRQAWDVGERPVVFTAARLVRRKAVDLVIRALPQVQAQVPDVVYFVAGTGPERAGLERLSEALGLADAVRFLGAVPYQDIPPFFRMCDVFVMTPRLLPPDVEAFGLVYLEANAAGKPVIGSRSGGIPDAVVDGQTGVLVAEQDVDGLAEAMVRILTKPELARQLGEQGRARVLAEMTWDHVAERMLRVMQASLASSDSR